MKKLLILIVSSLAAVVTACSTGAHAIGDPAVAREDVFEPLVEQLVDVFGTVAGDVDARLRHRRDLEGDLPHGPAVAGTEDDVRQLTAARKLNEGSEVLRLPKAREHWSVRPDRVVQDVPVQHWRSGRAHRQADRRLRGGGRTGPGGEQRYRDSGDPPPPVHVLPAAAG